MKKMSVKVKSSMFAEIHLLKFWVSLHALTYMQTQKLSESWINYILSVKNFI